MIGRRKVTEHSEGDERARVPETFVPQTPLGWRLWQIHSRIVESGEPLLDWKDVESLRPSPPALERAEG